jgi:uncharacterized glyoxalase superfamily protein PhnB
MQLNPYLTFNGQCEAAFKFYAQCLGGKIEVMITHGNSPMAEQVPAEWRDKIMHARLIVGDNVLMGSDAPPEHYEGIKGFSVSLGVDSTAEAERQRRNAYFAHWQKTGRCGCRCRRPSGRRVSACWSTDSAYHGWSTVSRPVCRIDLYNPSVGNRSASSVALAAKKLVRVNHAQP